MKSDNKKILNEIKNSKINEKKEYHLFDGEFYDFEIIVIKKNDDKFEISVRDKFYSDDYYYEDTINYDELKSIILEQYY